MCGIVNYDDRLRTHEDVVHGGPLGASRCQGRRLRGVEPDEQPERCHMESLAVSKQEVVTAQPGTDWTAIQGSRCGLAVAACAGVLADRRGWRAAIRCEGRLCVSTQNASTRRAVQQQQRNRDSALPCLRWRVFVRGLAMPSHAGTLQPECGVHPGRAPQSPEACQAWRQAGADGPSRRVRWSMEHAKRAPSQPSRAPWIRTALAGAGVPCCKLPGRLMQSSVPLALSPPGLLGVAGHSFSNSQPSRRRRPLLLTSPSPLLSLFS